MSDNNNPNPLNNLNDLNNTPDTTGQYSQQDIEGNKVMALLSYIGILWLIPLLAAKDSPYARFHANQGIVLFLFAIVVNIARFILAYIPVVGGILGWALYLVWLAMAILGIVNAVQGKAKQLPLIGGITLLK